jgi:hypothetical protein
MRYLLDGRVPNLPLAICYPEDGQQTDVLSNVPARVSNWFTIVSKFI